MAEELLNNLPEEEDEEISEGGITTLKFKNKDLGEGEFSASYPTPEVSEYPAWVQIAVLKQAADRAKYVAKSELGGQTERIKASNELLGVCGGDKAIAEKFAASMPTMFDFSLIFEPVRHVNLTHEQVLPDEPPRRGRKS